MATTKKFRVKHGLDASNNLISHVATPQSATDAANRQFVIDQVESGVSGVANTSTSSVTWTKANNTLEFTRADSSTFDVVLTDVGEVSNTYLTSTFTTNTDFQSFVANTNAYIATKTDDTVALDTNTAIRALLSSTYATNTEFRSYVDTSVAALVNSAPTTLNTLDELASALGDDPNLSTTLTTLIGTKASNTYVNTLLSNTNAYIATKADSTTVESYLANTNSYIASVDDQRNSDLANTNAYIASVSDAQGQYLQVANVSGYIPANTSTSTAVYTIANATLTFTRDDSSTFDVVIDSASVEVSNTAPTGANEGDMWWDNSTGELYIYYSSNWVEAVAQDVTPYANNGSYDASTNSITIVRTDGSNFSIDLAGVGEVSNAYLTSTYTSNAIFQAFVANTNAYIATKTDDTVALNTNTAIRALLSSTYATNTEFRSYVDTSIANLVNSAPTTLNTLEEIATALGDDPNLSATLTSLIGTKASNTYVNTLLANTNAYISSVSDAQSQYLQVANTTSLVAPYLEVANSVDFLVQSDVDQYLQVANVSGYILANTSTSTANYTVANATLTFTRADSTTFDVVIDSASVEVSNTAPSGANEGDMWWDNASGELYIYYSNNWVEAVAQDVTPYANNGSYNPSNNTITIVRTDGSQFDVVLNGVGEVTNTYITSTYVTNTVFQSALANTNSYIATVSGNQSQYLQVANSTGFLEQSDVNQYLQVANSTNFLVQSDVDQYLQVANVASYGFATESYVDTSVAALVNSAPTTLNTLDELAAALGDDANFATSVATTLGTKASNTYVNTLLANTNSYIASVSEAQSQYLQVANSTNFLIQSDVDQYLQVANSTNFLVQSDVDQYLQVANSTNFLVQSDVDQYLQVANVSQYILANTSTTSASLSGNTVTFTRSDSSTFDLDLSAFAPAESASVTVSNTAPTITADGDLWWDNSTGELYIAYANNWVEAVPQDVTPYTNNASYTTGNTTLTFVRTDGSQYEVALDLSNLGGGDVTNTYLQTQLSQYLEAANSTNFLVQSDVDQYLQVANVSSYGFATESYVDTSVAALVNSAPTTLNTLDELAAALGDDANFATSVATTLGSKASNTYVNTLLANTNAYIASVSDAQSQYLEVANSTSFITASALSPYLEVANSTNFLVQSDVDQYLQVANIAGYILANTSTTSASLSGNTVTFTRADSSTFNLDLSTLQTGGDATVTFSNTAPTAEEGKLWYDTDTSRLFGYYGSAWVQLAEPFGSSGGTTGGITPGANAVLNVVDANTVNTGVLTASSIQLTGGSGNEGTLTWNDSDRTLNLNQNDTTLQLGQEIHFMVRNASGSTIENGTFLGFAGVTVGSNRIIAAPFDPSTMTAHLLIGFATEDINNGVNGLATTFGYVRELDTRGTANTAMSVGDEDWSVGDLLYVHPTVAGKLTTVAPTTGLKAAVGAVVNRHQTEGEIFVRVTPINENIVAPQYLEVANVSSYGFATETYVDTSVAALVNSAPETLNTLAELSNALGNDENYATTTATLIGTKASNTYVNTLLANTNAYIASVSTAQSQYLQVANVSQYIPANTSTTSAVLSGNTATFTRADSSTFELDLSTLSTGGGGGASVTVGSTPPTSPSEGDLYFDNELATMFIYYDSSWIEVQSSTLPSSPVNYNVDTYTANGTATAFGHTADNVSADAMLVTVDGIVQRPTTDYTVSGNTVTFGTAPTDASSVSIRVQSGAVNSSNSFSSVSVSGGETVSSTTSTDTLNIVAGNNISIVATNANNTLEISSTASGGGGVTTGKAIAMAIVFG